MSITELIETLSLYVLNKLQEWGLLIMSVLASSSALSMGLGWAVIFRRLIFSTITAVVIASACYYGLKWEFALSCACGYFSCFLIESAFRQRLDALGRGIADKTLTLIKSVNLPSSRKGETGDE